MGMYQTCNASVKPTDALHGWQPLPIETNLYLWDGLHMTHTNNSSHRLSRIRAMCRSGVARDIRLSNDLSLRDVAAGLAVTHVTIYRWESGLARPAGQAAMRYLDLLDELSGVAR